MRIVSIILCFALIYSCKEENYKSFSGRELDFVNYSPNQSFKLIDTNSIVHTLIQDTIVRKYSEFIGIWGRTGNFQEIFSVEYYSITAPYVNHWLSLSLSGKFLPYERGELSIIFYGYSFHSIVDSLPPTISTITINGIDYSDVYSLRLNKGWWYSTSTDTARLYYNRQYGPIQLLLPNGKTVTRTN